MKTGFPKSTENKKAFVVTIGNFDGLHKGHTALINKVCELKKKHNLTSAVFTFNVNTKCSNNLIFPQNQLSEYLKDFDIDYILKPDFLNEIKGLSCEEFVKSFLTEKLNVKYAVVGENFFFGNGKSGNAQTLKELGKKYVFKTIIIKSKTTGGKTISSTLIREYLKEGKISLANRLTYRNFSFYGIVKKGYQVGSSILSIPTANISYPKNAVIVKNGVYASLTTIDGKKYKSITNIGKNPTKPKKHITAETNIMGFSSDIYKKRIKVELVKYIRNETVFPTAEALKMQIEKDIKTVEKFFLNSGDFYENN